MNKRDEVLLTIPKTHFSIFFLAYDGVKHRQVDPSAEKHRTLDTELKGMWTTAEERSKDERKTKKDTKWEKTNKQKAKKQINQMANEQSSRSTESR